MVILAYFKWKFLLNFLLKNNKNHHVEGWPRFEARPTMIGG